MYIYSETIIKQHYVFEWLGMFLKNDTFGNIYRYIRMDSVQVYCVPNVMII